MVSGRGASITEEEFGEVLAFDKSIAGMLTEGQLGEVRAFEEMLAGYVDGGVGSSSFMAAQGVPEPGSLALLGMGGVLLMRRRGGGG